MLLLFIIFHLVVAVIANPFHKYPYVFLLDVGNEDIQKFDNQQIRLSIPGGSLAIKYPATGDGDTIGHVRVSGIDFGTDLKASIVQGGPGYKYVVLVFLGNPGVSYDAVVTIQTIPNIDDSSDMSSDDENQISEDHNDSAEETEDSSQTKKLYSENALITQSSSNVYKYTNSEQGQLDDNVHDENQSDEGDGNEENDDKVNNEDNEGNEDQNVTYLKEENSENAPENTLIGSKTGSQYGKYQAFKPLIIGGVRFYPQAGVYSQDDYSKPIYDFENHINDDTNDDDEINEIKYKDSNNNLDSDYGSVDY